MKTNRWWISLLSLALAGVSSSSAAPFLDSNFADACKKAKAGGTIVLVDFYTAWCAPCKLLDQKTWTDPEVVKLLESKTVALRIDAEKEVDLAKRYQIDAYPTVLLLHPDGTEIDRLIGFREPAAFIPDFNAALSGKDSVSRARAVVQAKGTNNAMARMSLAQALVEKQKYAEALDEYLWCFDHGLENDPSFVGVRSSFLLTYIMTLSKKYPPAQEALETRRNDRETAVLSGPADSQTTRDLLRLNDTLGQKECSLSCFDRLPPNSPSRRVMRESLVEQLLSAKRYEDILQNGDPSAIFSQQVANLKTMLAHFEQNDARRAMLESSFRKRAVSSGSQYLEALAGLHRNAEAKALADDILKFDSTAPTSDELVQGAEQAGNDELVAYIKAARSK